MAWNTGASSRRESISLRRIQSSSGVEANEDPKAFNQGVIVSDKIREPNSCEAKRRRKSSRMSDISLIDRKLTRVSPNISHNFTRFTLTMHKHKQYPFVLVWLISLATAAFQTSKWKLFIDCFGHFDHSESFRSYHLEQNLLTYMRVFVLGQKTPPSRDGFSVRSNDGAP